MTCFMFLFSSVFYKKITDMNICETQVCVGCRLEAAAASIGLSCGRSHAAVSANEAGGRPSLNLQQNQTKEATVSRPLLIG